MEKQKKMNGHSGKEQGSMVGLVQWFEIGQKQQVQQALADMELLQISSLRTFIPLDQWQQEATQVWYDWLFETLSGKVSLLPCLVLKGPVGVQPRNVGEPALDPDAYLLFAGEIIARYGRFFTEIELGCSQDYPAGTLSTGRDNNKAFAATLNAAAHLAKQQGKAPVLGGIHAFDPDLLSFLLAEGCVQQFEAIGLYGHEAQEKQWHTAIKDIQELLRKNDASAAIWITNAGCDSKQHGERRQAQSFIEILSAGTERIYWANLQDAVTDLPASVGVQTVGTETHPGIKYSNGAPKLLFTLLSTGGSLQDLKRFDWMLQDLEVADDPEQRYTLITGGSGFVGVNLAHRLLSEGRRVLVLDNLSRGGVIKNLLWLKEQHPQNLQVLVADVRDKRAVQKAVQGAAQVFHFAAQVAVTSSLIDPYYDFEVNALGTLNVLEAIRNTAHKPSLLFTSTNKVYGDLEDIGMVAHETRYQPKDAYYRAHGINELRSLDFHSPYGCTKGVADQYILDYARTFGLKTVVFRMSCIYGPHQFGTEDQGWVAHFLIQALKGKPITLYGDGKQVRDILFVEDLVDAFMLAQENMDTISGHAFNMGGGVHNTVSLLELIDMIGDITGEKPEVFYEAWRPSDQKYYVSDFSRFSAATGWMPRYGTHEGVTRLCRWLQEHAGLPVHKKSHKPKAAIVTNSNLEIIDK